MTVLSSLYDQPSIPADYAASLDQIAPNITSMVDQVQTPGESWTDTLARILPSVVATYQQKQLMDLQVERAKQGLPPLKADELGLGVNVGLSADTKQLLLYGGGAALVIWLATSAYKHR